MLRLVIRTLILERMIVSKNLGRPEGVWNDSLFILQVVSIRDDNQSELDCFVYKSTPVKNDKSDRMW